MSDSGGTTRVVDLVTWAVRTYVPVGVALALTWAGAKWHVVIDDQLTTMAAAALIAGLIAGYTLAAKALENAKGDSSGARTARLVGRWLHGGVVKKPVYLAPDDIPRLLRWLRLGRPSVGVASPIKTAQPAAGSDTA